jgi:hypothetical protein
MFNCSICKFVYGSASDYFHRYVFFYGLANKKRTVEIRNCFPLLWPGKSFYPCTLSSFRIYGFELAEMLGIEAQPAESPQGN